LESPPALPLLFFLLLSTLMDDLDDCTSSRKARFKKCVSQSKKREELILDSWDC